MLALFLPMFITNQIQEMEIGSCYIYNPNPAAMLTISILGNHLPFCLIIFCYWRLIISIRKKIRIHVAPRMHEAQKSRDDPKARTISPEVHRSNLTSVNSTVPASRSRVAELLNKQCSTPTKDNKAKRCFRTLTSIVICYIICILPFHVYFDVAEAYPELITTKVQNVILMLLYTNSAMNPILYCLNNTEFRQSFKRLLTCMCRK